MMDRRSWAGALRRGRRRWPRRTCACALAWLCALAAAPAGTRGADVSPIVIVDSAVVNDSAASTMLPAERDAAEPRADHAGDEILLISTRPLGTRCEPSAMAAGLRCEQRDPDGRWRRLAWSDLLATLAADPRPTVIYVHGNRVAAGEDKTHGLAFYRWFAARKAADAPLRYIIWSWPSAQIPGRLRDYEVKAARTRPCGWQLAWAIDQMPPETPLALVGYSYGARLATGALHLLGGGRMGNLELAERAHAERPPLRVALVAAAVDAHWLRPEGYHGRAVSQCETLVLVNNQLDPAMRFYPISPVGSSPALGYAGVPGRASLGELADRIHAYDLTSAVGRHHALSAYLTSRSMLGRALGQVVDLPAATPDVEASSIEASTIAGRADGDRQ